jgi:hypothetical protein
MNTSGSGRSDAWMMLIPLAALLIFTSFSNGGPESLFSSLDSLLRGTVRAVVDMVSSLF